MASWDYRTGVTLHCPPKRERNGWYSFDCGCCGGIEWGGEDPRECDCCSGSGSLWVHIPSGVFAKYPGGKFSGRTPDPKALLRAERKMARDSARRHAEKLASIRAVQS
jgi:hypothetical protein